MKTSSVSSPASEREHKMKETVLKLTPENISGLRKTCPLVEVDREWDLTYDGQIPIGAVVLIEGVAHLTRKNRLHEKVETGSVYGFIQLRDRVPVKYGYRLREGARVIILHSADLTKIKL